MRFLILGAGAIGGYFGGRLLQGGADVTFLVRPGRRAQLAARGLVVLAQDGDIRMPARTVEAGAVGGAYDVVLLTCKAYDLATAIDAVAPAVGPDSVVLPLLNGMRHLDTLAARFGRGRVLGGMTAVNAVLRANGDIYQSPLKVDMNVTGELDGGASARCRAIQAAFAAGGAGFTVADDIVAQMWAKFFAFTCIATIATLTRARAGRIASSEAGAAFVAAVTEECAAVAAAEGYPQPPGLHETVRAIFAERGSGYGPSILVDIENRHTTEAEHTVVDMWRRARAHGLAAPLLTAAAASLQCHELGLADSE